MMVTSLALVVLGQAGGEVSASRVDMGIRLRVMDAAWVKADAAKKKQAMPLVNRAVMGFFSGQFGPVCQQLDQATAILENRSQRAGEELIFRVKPQIYEPGETVEVTIARAYAGSGSLVVKWEGQEFNVPANGTVVRNVKTQDRAMAMIYPPFHESVRGTESFSVGDVQFDSGSAWLVGAKDWGSKGAPAVGIKQGLARVAHPHWNEVARQLSAGRLGGLESPFTVADAAARAESTVPEVQKDLMPIYARWDNTVIRVSGGSGPFDKPSKYKRVLIALHGAGGSENMFPESYGAGGFIDRAVKDGWLVVSPRASGNAVRDCRAWLTAQGVKMEKLVIAGHSMGGGLALGAAADDVDAIVVFAPAGGKMPEGIPVFVGLGAGELPMLKGTVEALGKQATEFKTYENAEHLMVVAEGMDDAWKFVRRVTGD